MTLLSPSQVTFCTYDCRMDGSPDSWLKPCPPHARRQASMPSLAIQVLSACAALTRELVNLYVTGQLLPKPSWTTCKCESKHKTFMIK
jgi:hypothetical protein